MDTTYHGKAIKIKKKHLWLPNYFRDHGNRYVFDSEFLLILWLTHTCTGGTVVDLDCKKVGSFLSLEIR